MDRHTVQLITRLAPDYDQRMSRRKRRLFDGLRQLKAARGDGRLVIIEIGSGSGANFQYYPDGAQIICIERNSLFEAPLRSSLAQRPGVEISQFLVASAENMRDVPSNSVDAVVSTKVLCSVTDVDRCLQEILRVLKPGGKLFYLEHVKSPPEFYVVRCIQTVINVPWRLLRSGCNLSRTTQDSIRRAGFSVVELDEFEAHELMRPTRLMWCIRLSRSHIAGTATK